PVTWSGYGVDCRARSVHPSISVTVARLGSDQAGLRHPVTTAYRCFLPDLTGFAGHCCTGPDRQRLDTRPGAGTMDLGRGFSPAEADCGYRAPLAPRLPRLVNATTATRRTMMGRTRMGTGRCTC